MVMVKPEGHIWGPEFYRNVCFSFCGLLMPHVDRGLDQYWLVAWWHQAITLTNVDLLPKVFCSICSIHLRAISQGVLMNSNHNMCFKITLLRLQLHILGANESISVSERGSWPWCEKSYCMQHHYNGFSRTQINSNSHTTSLVVRRKGRCPNRIALYNIIFIR